MSEILKEVKRIIAEIDTAGYKINKTKEINNVISKFFPHKLNLLKEEEEIKYFYDKYVSDWNKRMELEKDHYTFLTAFIIHKIKENQYFFKLGADDFTSRKNVIHSNDCILGAQFLCRPGKNLLNVYIRSSDTVNLLLADYLFGVKLLDMILERFNIKKNKLDKVTFYTTSSHWYLNDIIKVKKILE